MAMELTWSSASDAESGVEEYGVYRDGSRVGGTSDTSFEDTGLRSSTTYAYEVSAVNGAGLEGPPAGPVSAETGPDETPPPAPPRLSAEGGGATTVQLTWGEASDAESGVDVYRVYRDGTRIGEVSDTTYEDTGLAPSTSYSYEVSAVNGAGLEGDRAGPESAETEPDETAPTAPTELRARGTGATTVELTWEAASDAESGVDLYRVYRDGARVAETSDTGFEDTGLRSSTTYTYEVSAVNGAGLEGARAGPASARTDPDETPPSVPEDFSAEATGPETAELDWSPSTDPESGVESYLVYRNGWLIAEVTSTGYTDDELDEGGRYAYEVAAVNGAGLVSDRTDREVVRTPEEEEEESR